MKWFSDLPMVYLHRAPVDFRKAVNGLCELVEQELVMNPFDENLYVFCNRSRDRLKILHWDQTGFVLWYKRLEKEKFKWPVDELDPVIQVNEQSLNWLLSGLTIRTPKGHKTLFYSPLGETGAG
jgi:transposase